MIGSSSHDGPIVCNPIHVIDGYHEIVEASGPVQSIAYNEQINCHKLYMFRRKSSMASCIDQVMLFLKFQELTICCCVRTS